jgi:uncharacterized protein
VALRKRVVALVMPLAAVASLGAAGRDLSLVEAVKSANTAAVRTLLAKPGAVDTAEPDGTTALHYAVYRDDLATADLLIGAGARVGAANSYGVTPLALACENGSTAMIERLLAAGADANSASPAGETVLMTASRTGRVDAVRVLLAHGAKVNEHEASHGQTALMWAAAANNADVVRALIDAGAEVNAHALGTQVNQAVRRRKGAPPERPKATFTALFYAVRAGHLQSTALLIAGGAKVNEVLPDGNTALMEALLNANWEVADALLDAGADPKVDQIGWSPLHQLAISRRPNNHGGTTGPKSKGTLDSLGVIRKLAAHGADVNARMTKDINTGQRNKFFRIGATPFLLAAKTCDYQQMRLLADLGADPKATNDVGDTALMVAAGLNMWNPSEDAGTDEDCLEAVKLAHALGNDVNARNEWDETALIGAAVRGAVPIVDYLVDHGADLLATSKRGWNAWGVAHGIFYSNHVVNQPAAEARLGEILAARGVATDALEIDLSHCVGCDIGNRRVEDDQRYKPAAGKTSPTAQRQQERK